MGLGGHLRKPAIDRQAPFGSVPNGAKLRGYCLLNRNLNPNPNLDLNLLVENGLRLGL
jgi:hypothetical protein